MNRKEKLIICLGCSTTSTVLNLHYFKRDSYIANWMSGPHLSGEGRRAVAVTHLASLGVKR